MLYTEDAVALPPGAGVVKGRTAIAAMWKSDASAFVASTRFLAPTFLRADDT
jgi:ketosteroid isomerase-like protein